MNRRGLSPVVATVLLISLVIILILIIFIWAKGFISESVQKNGLSADEACSKVELEYGQVIKENSQIIDLSIINRGNVPIYQLSVKSFSGGDTETNVIDVSVPVGGSSVQNLPVLDSATKVTFYPVILGNVEGKNTKKAYTCLNMGQTYNLL